MTPQKIKIPISYQCCLSVFPISVNLHKGDPNGGGNHRKCITRSVHDSLKRLGTDYIDLFYLHAWEGRTQIEDVLRTLDDLVTAGKVLYIGISNSPAWKVAEANTIAHFRGWSRFVALQIQYNLAERTAERELIPMAQDFGLSVLPWAPLFGGVLSGKYNTQHPAMKIETKRQGINGWKLTERNLQIAHAVQKIAMEVSRSPSQVALNWLLRKQIVCAPVIGARTSAQLQENLGCLDFLLDESHMQRLDEVSQVDLGYPHNYLNTQSNSQRISGGCTFE